MYLPKISQPHKKKNILRHEVYCGARLFKLQFQRLRAAPRILNFLFQLLNRSAIIGSIFSVPILASVGSLLGLGIRIIASSGRSRRITTSSGCWRTLLAASLVARLRLWL
jgi:hypothetical protein